MKIPYTPFSTHLSGSARETELRLRNIFQWKKKRPPVVLFVLTLVVLLSCFGLFSCTPQEEPPTDEPVAETTTPIEEPKPTEPAKTGEGNTPSINDVEQGKRRPVEDVVEPSYEQSWPQVLNEMPAVSTGNEIIDFFSGDITIILPESWSGKVGYEWGDDWVTFYHLDTRESEGWEGAGVLFTVDWDLGALPLDYPFGTPTEVLASTATAVYMLQLPSDGQCGPETIEEFRSLKLSEVQLVLADWLLENSVNKFNWVEGTAAVNVNGETFFLYNAESSARLNEIVLSKEYTREVTNFPLAYDIQFWLYGNLYYVNTSAGQLISKTDTFRSAALTADELQTVVGILGNTVATQPGLSIILDAYRAVLRGEQEYYAPESDQFFDLTEIKNIKTADFTVVDLDQDGIPEVVVVVDWGTAMASYSVILHYRDGAVHGYTKYIRQFNYLTLKEDGTFGWAGSAFYHGIGRLAFGQQEVVTDDVTYVDATVDPTVYVVDYLPTDGDAFDAAYAAQDDKPDVTWYELTEENINTLLEQD